MIYHVEFDVEVEDTATVKQAVEWIRFTIGDTGKMSHENPMRGKPFDPMFRTVKISGKAK
jgi:hypothetical protein